MKAPEQVVETDRGGLLRRTELLATLERATRKRVTIVSALAGSGKTTLLREWARSSTDRVVIVSSRPGEMDAQQFEDALDLLESPPQPVTLIVDDLHELKSAEALARLEALIERLPANARVILASRRDPQIHLHRLRLVDEVAEIRANDLRLSEAETGTLLRGSGLTLSDEAVASLHDRTEGWAAGLRLAAISMADHPDPERFVEEFSGGHRAVAEYLIAEMLDSQPAEVRDLLLRTSLVDRVNGGLADLLGGQTGSERILLELEDANAFVVSLDPGRTWFRFHQLLTDFLWLELRRTMADEVPVLHRRAADWLLDHGDVLAAVRHLLAAGDRVAAVEIISDNVFGLALDGSIETVDSLLASLPRGAAAEHPELALARAITRLEHGHLEEAATHLDRAESHLGGVATQRRPRLAAAVASSRQALARRRGQFGAVIDLVEALESRPDDGSEEHLVLTADLRAVTMMHLGIVEMWSGSLVDAERHLREGADLAEAIGRPYLEVACRANLAFLSGFTSFSIGRERSENAIELAERFQLEDRPVVAPALVTIGGNMVCMGEFDGARHWLERASTALEGGADPALAVHLHASNGMLHAALGDLPGALAKLLRAEENQAQVDGEHVLAGMVSGWRVATEARLGQVDEARASLAALPGHYSDKGEIRNARAVIELADGDSTAALDTLAGVVEGSLPVAHDLNLVEAHLLAAKAYARLGRREDTRGETEAALAVAEQEGLILPFALCDALPLIEDLHSHTTSHGALRIEVRQMLTGSTPTRRSVPSDMGLDPLSPSELRVLGYLPTNLTRPEIAGQLFVSLNTVNTHIRNIYAKLGVNGRSDAVATARAGKLLAAGRSR
jgi:LuxR family transcriptional regulator, maltose regulon positive regulatory protein